MKLKLCGLFIAAYLNAMLIEAFPTLLSSDNIYIYGKISTTDGDSYTGQIRWGKEEAFWFDHFNSEKPKNEFMKYLDDDQVDALNDVRNNNKGWNWNWNSCNSYSSNNHAFECHFGDIKSIEPARGDRLYLTLKDDTVLKLDGGSNDVGATVRIYDEELGTVKLDWDDIELVEFMETPSGLRSAFGEPLYGTVKTYEDEFTGYVQWDHDERLTSDELNGDTDNGSFDIEFGNIESIENARRGSKVTLRSGRTLYMTGSNDVCDDNRGIIVNIPGMGRVDITWDDFESLEFTSAPSIKEVNYSSYGNPQNINGEVVNKDGQKFNGRIVFDLDEEFQLEILNGEDDGLEYKIPFRNISSISPRSRKSTMVKLKDGTSYELEDSVDVNDDNDGVLVFTSGEDYNYIPWDEVEKINLD